MLRWLVYEHKTRGLVVIYLAGVCAAGAVVSFQLRLQHLGYVFLVLSLLSLAA
jgi:hypothetical protein